MADKSKIEWTDSTWNPIRGCSVVSEGCRNCYAMNVAARFSGEGQAYEGLAYRNTSGAHWTGEVRLIEEHLEDPLRWKRPRRIFVNSMSDLFHESIPDAWIDRIFAVMAMSRAMSRGHVFQVLTKRPERAKRYLDAITQDPMQRLADDISEFAGESGARIGIKESEVDVFAHMFACSTNPDLGGWPLPNIWLGVSVENQKTADERIPILLETPAAVRWVSAEPLLGPVDLRNLRCGTFNAIDGIDYENIGDIRDAGVLGKSEIPSLDWLVVGGESGPGARPMHPDWARSLRDQCVAAGVPFFFKQWGEWGRTKTLTRQQRNAATPIMVFPDGHTEPPFQVGAGSRERAAVSWRVGKKAAGRLLDGREWNEYPAVEVVSA